MPDLFSLKSRVALITGASRGLGRDMAHTLAAAGATVLCAGRDEKALKATVASIVRKGGKAEVQILDVTDEAAAREAIANIVKRHRRLDILVNNAGIIHRQNAIETATEDFAKVVNVNLIAQFVLAREAAKAMKTRGYGKIVNIASILGVVARANVSPYVSAKHGLVGLTKVLAAELGPEITVNAIAPGYIATEINVVLQENKEFGAFVERHSAAKRWGKPADLRGALLLLCSDASAFISGHTLVVDGGMTTMLG
jgi:NAD(P)-dependent dehydrogenase (short-subunit alcohol dehydrogenase family)